MSETTLLERLRSSELLSPEQMRELERLPEAREGEPKALAKAVLHRGWLTKFQISQVAMGKGKDLSVGPYVLQDRLGEGGMGQVFKARHRHMKRLVALKLIRKEKLASEDAVHRFYQEVEAAAQLTHPNIVMAFDAGQAGSSHFFSMEYVEGMDLMRLVHDQGVLPVAEACEFIRQAAVGLQHAHERGLVHRDIKPANLLLASGAGTPVVKILDMGLARLGDTFAKERNLTKMGQVLGTPDYLAPEQAIDARNVDIRADIYSLGCSLFFLLTRRAPFQAESLAELLMKHQMEEPTPLRSLRPDAPPALEDLLRRLLAKKPEQRPATPAAVAAALEPFARGEKGDPVSIPVPPASSTRGDATFAGLTNDGEGIVARPPRSKPDRTQDTMSDRPRPRRQEDEKKINLPLLIAGGVGAGVVALMVLIGGLVLLLRPAAKPAEQTAQTLPKTAPGKGEAQPPVTPAPAAPLVAVPPPPAKEEAPGKPLGDGSIFDVVEAAVREGKTTKTPLRGSGSLAYDEVPPEGALLVGFKLGLGAFNRQDVIQSIQPIFQSRKGKITGAVHGTESPRIVTVEAKPGYAVGGVTTKSGLGIDGMSVTFMAIEGSSLNQAKFYESDWVGGEGGGLRRGLRGGGAPVVGVFGKTSPQFFVHGFGLVLLRKQMAAPPIFVPPPPPPITPPTLPPEGTILALTGKVDGQVGGFRLDHAGVIHVRFVKDVKRAVVLSEKAVRLYDLETSKVIRTYPIAKPETTCLAVAPDGKTLAAVEAGGEVWLVDVESGARKLACRDSGGVAALAFAPDSKHLAAVHRAITRRGGEVVPLGYHAAVLDVDHLGGRHNCGIGNTAPHSAAFCDDGKVILGGTPDQALWLWGAPPQVIVRHKRPPKLATSFTAPLNNQEVLLADVDGTIHLWDWSAGQMKKTFRGHRGTIHEMTALPGGKQFLSVAGAPGKPVGDATAPDTDPTLRLWDVPNGVEVGRTTFPRVPWSVDVAPDGAHALVGELDGSVRLIDLRKLGAPAPTVLKPAERFAGHKGTVNCVAFSPDGKYLLTGGEDSTARLWDARSGVEISKFVANGSANWVRFSGNGKRLLVLEGGNSGRVYDTAKGVILYSVNFSSTTNQVRGDLSADGMEALVTGDRFLYTFRGNLTTQFATSSIRSRPVRVTCAAYAADGDFYAYGDALGAVGVYSMTLAKEVGNYSAHKGVPVLCIAAHGGKSPRVISGGQDKVIVVRTGKTLTTNRRLLGHEGPVTSVSLSADGKRLASCSKDSTVRVWDLTTSKMLRKFTAEEQLLGVAIAPDGKTVVSCSEKGLQFWDLAAPGKP